MNTPKVRKKMKTMARWLSQTRKGTSLKEKNSQMSTLAKKRNKTATKISTMTRSSSMAVKKRKKRYQPMKDRKRRTAKRKKRRRVIVTSHHTKSLPTCWMATQTRSRRART